MRLIDADILSYALFKKHNAHPFCWPVLLSAVHGKIRAAITTVTLLETYHALVNDYLVDPKEAHYKLDGLSRSRRILFIPITVEITGKALEIAKNHNVRSFDANVIASAEVNGITVIMSNDRHIERLCRERNLISENPIPEDVRSTMKT